jgi:hypothetical protein
MSHSKLSSVISLLAIAGAVFLLPGCAFNTKGTGTSPSSGQQGSFFLEYNNTFDQPGDDVGGAKTPVDVPVVWAGSRQVGAEEQQAAGDTFNISSTWHGIATDPWYTTTIVPNLKPGTWNLSVTVNGQLMTCPTVIELASGTQVNVTFQVSKETGQFTGCTSNGASSNN